MAEAAAPAPGTWVILGAGGHARSVADVIERAGGVVVAVAGDAPRPWSVPVLPDDRTALARAATEGHLVGLGVGSNAVRAALTAALSTSPAINRPVVALTATVAPDVEVGPWTVVLEHAHVGPGTRLGAAAVVNTAAVVEHDCVLGHAVHVAPGAVVLGGVLLGDGVLVGSGARILPGIRVGRGAVIGAGAVVRENVDADRTVVGIPARPAGHD
jgi:sugar O-acyltransferase (sialic acid O-acetyltransferase NeuD family)